MYERIIRDALQTPWAITPQYLSIVQDVLCFRANGGRLTAEELQTRLGAAAPKPAARSSGLIAVIPIYGVIAHRTFAASSGMTSTELIGDMLQRAVADEQVTTILLDVSSPGGTIEGVPELAAQIYAARKKKYIVAQSNALMASAAYWLGAQAHEIVVTPSGGVGSIGVFALFEDWSDHLAKEGVKVNAISAGDYKLEGAPWEPMSPETKAYVQAQVDGAYADFVGAIAKGRGTTVTNVKQHYGQGRVFGAEAALAAGMVDAVASMDQTIARLATRTATSSRSRMAATDVADGVTLTIPSGTTTSANTTTSAALTTSTYPVPSASTEVLGVAVPEVVAVAEPDQRQRVCDLAASAVAITDVA